MIVIVGGTVEDTVAGDQVEMRRVAGSKHLVQRKRAVRIVDYRVDGVTQTLTRTSGGLGNGNFEDFSGANFTSSAAFQSAGFFPTRTLSSTSRTTI